MPASQHDTDRWGSMAAGSSDTEIDLRAWWRVLVKRRAVLLAVLLVVFVTTAILTFATKPLYRATAQILIERRPPAVLPFQELTVNESGADFKVNDMFYQTQLRLLQSRTLSVRVLERLRLRESPEFAEIRAAVSADRQDGDPDQPYVDAFLQRVQVAQVRNARLFDISYLSHDPARAATIANALADAFIELNGEVTSNTTETATHSLEKEIRGLQENARRSELELQAYARENKLIYLHDDQNVALRSLQDLTDDHNGAITERIDLEARHTALGRADAESIPEVLTSKVVNDLRADYSRLAQQHSEMSSTFGPDWPQMKEIAAKMQTAKERLDAEIQEIVRRVVKGAEREYHKALERERGLRKAIDAQTTQAQKSDLMGIRYRTMKADLDSKNANLQAMLKRAGEAGISAGVQPGGSNVRVIDRATVPSRPYKPRIAVNLAMGLLLGLLGGVAISVFVEYLDNSIRTADEVAQLLHLPVLAQIPHCDGQEVGPLPARTSPQTGSPLDCLCISHPLSPAAESFRELRTALLLTRPDSPPRTILITSALLNEGKTMVATNLATALAQAGRRVLLVDADLRRPRLHRSFAVQSAPGIGSVLAGSHTLEEVIHPGSIPGLDVIMSGPHAPNPAELLGSAAFRKFLADLEGRDYDHIVFDSSPALSVADPLILASQLEAVILVHRAHVTPRDAARDLRTKLAQSKVSVIGCVLNGAIPAHDGRYHWYGHAPASHVPEERPAARVEPVREKVTRLRPPAT
jgi:capsular exopolysaccharide synthesis family protein